MRDFVASNDSMTGRLDPSRLLELVAVLVLSVSAIALFSARLGFFQAPQAWLAALAMTWLYSRLTPRQRSLPSSAPWWHLAAVVAVGLFFRLTPYTYVMGGQDQGVYANMAMELVRTGGLQPADAVLHQLTGPALDLYRQANYQPTIYLPGVYSTDGGLQFQFYHLFPVWLALLGDIFGPKGAGYSLTLLSIVSLLFFQRLAHVLSGEARVGLVAGLLLAVNPLHAFFSKFPVTEVPALAFSTIAFAFLCSYWRAPDGTAQRRYLGISVVAMAMLFMTRITGFMYMPIVLAIAVVSLLFVPDATKRRQLVMWALVVSVLYALSVVYGLKWSNVYAKDIYQLAFAPLFGQRWRVVLGLMICLVALGWLVVWYLSRHSPVDEYMRRCVLAGGRLLPVLALILATVAVYKAYRLGYTDAYALDPNMGKRFGLSHQGLRSVFSVSLMASATYLSPFILLAFFVASFRAFAYPLLNVLLVFVVCFLAYVTVMQWNLPYQPYYARYLVSEFVPYLILFVVCVWSASAQGVLRKTLAGALVLGGLWGTLLSAQQIGKHEHDGVIDSLDRIAAHVDHGDLVLVDKKLRMPLIHELKTPLVFTYGLNVATVDESGLDERYLEEATGAYDDIYLISQDPVLPDRFVKTDSIHFTEPVFDHGVTPPTRTILRSDTALNISRYVPGPPRRYEFGVGETGPDLLGPGWNAPESWGVWTRDNRAQLRIGKDKLVLASLQHPALKVRGRAYTTPKAPLQRIRVELNGKEVAAVDVTYPQQSFELQFALPDPADITGDGLEILIRTPDAVSPQSLGYSGDARKLALGLEVMRLVEAAPEE